MTNRDNPFHSHGSQGNKPSDGLDFQTGGNPKQQHFDFKWFHTIEKVKDFNAEFNRLDGDDDGIVDKADDAQRGVTDGNPFVIRDTTNGDDLLAANEGGGIEINDGTPPLSGIATLDVTSDEFGVYAKTSDTGGSGVRADNTDSGVDATIAGGSNFTYEGLRIRDTNNNPLFGVKSGGDVKIPNGSLEVSGFIDIFDNFNLRFFEDTTQRFQFIHNPSSDKLSVFDDTNSTDIIDFNAGGNVNIPNGNLSVRNGSIYLGDDSSSFYWGVDDDWRAYYRSGQTRLEFVQDPNGTPQVSLFLADNGDVGTPNGNLDLRGNNITNIGGTADANSGVIRMANNTRIMARDSGNSNDIAIISTTGSDDIFIGENGNAGDITLRTGGGRVNFDGNEIREIGGTADASTGAIRTAHNAAITQRDSGDSADIDLMKVDFSNRIVIGNGNESVVRVNSSPLDLLGGNLQMNGNFIKNVDQITLADSYSVLKTNGGGSDEFAVIDAANSQKITSFFEGGIVKIHNGDLNDGAGNTIYDQSNNYVPKERVEGGNVVLNEKLAKIAQTQNV